MASVERRFCRVNHVEQVSAYLDQTCSIEQLINQVGPEIDMAVDEMGDLLQLLQEQLAAFRFAAAPITHKQQVTIQQALDDCAQARTIQIKLGTFITSLQALSSERGTLSMRSVQSDEQEGASV
jgi:hypothetical protein